MAGIFGLLMSGAGVIKDQYYNLTSLLLPGNGTNGAQNNTFLDSSGNTFTITRNGNTTQGTFSPFSQTGWGNYFDGSGDYLTTPIANVQLGSGDFCVEQWVYLIARPNTVNCIFSNYTSYSTGVLGLYYGHAGGNTAKYQVGYNGSSFPSLQSTTDIVYNTWVHLAVVRSSGTIKLYINGVAESSTITSATATLNGNGASWWVGTEGQSGTTGVINAYVSNHRVVVGSPVYTGNFTPSTAPLTAISGTSLLTCQSNRFRDSSSNNHAITVNGNPSVTPFSPFPPTQSYSAAAVGGSGYFDGTGDYLSVADNTAINIGTSDFQIGFWIYPTAFAGSAANVVFSKGTNNIVVLFNNSGTLSVGQYGVATRVTSSSNITLNQWAYVVVSRVSSTTKIFLNGTEVGSASDTSNYTSTSAAAIGQDILSSTQIYFGYITDFRLIKGSGVTSVTVPTAPLTAITNTSLLLNFTNAGVVDATAKNVLETVGNAQISTTQSKWGGGSMRFPQSGTNDYLYKPYDPLLNQVNGNFTIECWIYPTVTSTRMIFAGLANAAGDSNWFWEITSGNKLAFIWTNTTPTVFTATSTASISPNTWTYIAVVKNGGTITQYINGSADGTSSPTGTYRNGSYGFGIGRAGDYNGLYFTGYIDDFRMTIGQARTITASPSAPFPVQ